MNVDVNDEDRHMAVVEYVVADAAEQGSANRAAAARAHHAEIVLTALDLVDKGPSGSERGAARGHV